MYRALVEGFLHFYKQNEPSENLKTSWNAGHGDNSYRLYLFSKGIQSVLFCIRKRLAEPVTFSNGTLPRGTSPFEVASCPYASSVLSKEVLGICSQMVEYSLVSRGMIPCDVLMDIKLNQGLAFFLSREGPFLDAY